MELYTKKDLEDSIKKAMKEKAKDTTLQTEKFIADKFIFVYVDGSENQ